MPRPASRGGASIWRLLLLVSALALLGLIALSRVRHDASGRRSQVLPRPPSIGSHRRTIPGFVMNPLLHYTGPVANDRDRSDRRGGVTSVIASDATAAGQQVSAQPPDPNAEGNVSPLLIRRQQDALRAQLARRAGDTGSNQSASLITLLTAEWLSRWERNTAQQEARESATQQQEEEILRSIQESKPGSSSSEEDTARRRVRRFRCECISLTGQNLHTRSWCDGSGPVSATARLCIVRNACLLRQMNFVLYADVQHPEDTGLQSNVIDPFAPPTADIRDVDICGVPQRTTLVYRRNSSIVNSVDSNDNSGRGAAPGDWRRHANPGGVRNNHRAAPEFTEEDIQRATWLSGTTVLISQSAGNHITHFMEGLGLLNMQIQRESVPDRLSNGSVEVHPCDSHDLRCVGRPLRVISVGGEVIQQSWQWHMLRVLLRDLDTTVKISHVNHMRGLLRDEGITSGDGENVCFEKVVLPGSYYSVFPRRDDQWAAMKADLWQYIRRLQHRRFVEAAGKAATYQPRVKAFAPQFHRGRVILLAMRTTKRRIVDADVFERIVRNEAMRVGATVKTIEFGNHNFIQQATAASEAAVLMGLHGADLTNTIMQLPNTSALIEMNPIFFFENRFYELAKRLGVHYLAWTCTARSCAFGGEPGNADSWQRFVVDINIPFNETSRILSGPAGPFLWPWDRYAGSACPECAQMACCGVMRPVYYNSFRQSDVLIGPHEAEIAHVLSKAFALVGWLDDSGRAVPPAAAPNVPELDDDEKAELSV